MEQMEISKDSLKDSAIRELRKKRGIPVSLEELRLKAFGKNDNQWQCLCQKLVISNIVRNIRDEFKIYIFSMTIDGHRGYIVIEKKEDFQFIVGRTISTINGFKMKLDKMKRDMNSGEYRKNVERFFKGI